MTDTDGDIDLKVRVARARQAKKEIDDVSKSVRELGDSTDDANKKVGKSSKAFDLFSGSTDDAAMSVMGLGQSFVMMGSRAVSSAPMVVGSIGAIVVAAVAGSTAIAFLIAGLAAAAATALPIMLLVKAATDRFQQTVENTESPAFRLMKAFEALRDVWRATFAPAADIILSSLARTLGLMATPLMALKRPMESFAISMSTILENGALAVADALPKLAVLISKLGPALAPLGGLIEPVITALLKLATAGVPVFTKMVAGAAAAIQWVAKAIVVVTDFFQGKTFKNELVPLLVEVGRYFQNIWSDFTTAWPDISKVLVVFIRIVTQVFRFLNDHWDTFNTIIGIVLPNLISLVNWISRIRDALADVKSVGNGMWEGLKAGLVSSINWIFDRLNKIHFTIPDWVPGLGGKEFGFNLIPIVDQVVPGAANGAIIKQGGVVDVGELGRERVWLPPAAVVQPLPSSMGEYAVIHTSIVVNDTVIAEAVQRAAVRKASTR